MLASDDVMAEFHYQSARSKLPLEAQVEHFSSYQCFKNALYVDYTNNLEHGVKRKESL